MNFYQVCSRDKNFLLLWQGQFVSSVGSSLGRIALALFIVDFTDSPTFMSMVMMLSTTIDLLLCPFSGALADRLCRRKIIIICDAGFGLLSIGLGIACTIFSDRPEIVRLLFIGYSIFTAMFSSIFSPTYNALIGDIVPAKRLPQANAMLQAAFNTATLLGKGSGGVLYRLLGGPILFIVDGISFLLSAFSECFIRIPSRPEAEEKKTKNSLALLWTDMQEGFRYIYQWKGLRVMLFIFAGMNFFYEPIFILMPFYVVDPEMMNKGKEWYGYLVGGLGGGSLVGYWITAQWSNRIPSFVSLIKGGLACQGLCYGGFVFVHQAWFCLACLVLIGICMGMFGNYFTTILQQKVPAQKRARVFAVMTSIAMGAAPLALGLSSILISLPGCDVGHVFTICGSAIGAIALWTMRSKDVHCFLENK